ncbi:uncharacterized protein EAF01_009934 [Botrytis porri]|uniref:Uncharacterized protein n=1 Tax=Botrytis porri TaxID=87229 RepID=A0A4Z1KX66_9HELO|nr:uncharacterized protein EAF01_009934 [Botrytis porri]KAF7894483.1 hypothetical protein EAF01_009934 [Botrytis porri]TGO89108.1 hypothetical protein BPOR_0125g00160 [Botrytis porri]
MISKAILALSLFFTTITATSIPICITDSSTTTSFNISSLSKYTTQLCTQIASSNFSSTAKNYNIDSTSSSIISLAFTSAATTCPGNSSASDCEIVYDHLLSGCSDNSSSITGSGSIDTGCGVYNFQLVNAHSNTSNANSTSLSSESGGSKASVVSYCTVTGSVLFGVAALFGWFL